MHVHNWQDGLSRSGGFMLLADLSPTRQGKTVKEERPQRRKGLCAHVHIV